MMADCLQCVTGYVNTVLSHLSLALVTSRVSSGEVDS